MAVTNYISSSNTRASTPGRRMSMLVRVRCAVCCALCVVLCALYYRDLLAMGNNRMLRLNTEL